MNVPLHTVTHWNSGRYPGRRRRICSPCAIAAAAFASLPPKEIEVAMERSQDARLLRAIGRTDVASV